MSTILEIKNVTKTFGDEIIFKNVNLIVKKGEVISIIGKSGSGKSTFLKCLNRLEEINGGEILFDNKNINNYPISILRQKIGLVFQDYNLFEHLTVFENLIIGLIKIKNYSQTKSEKMTLDILKKIDLLDKKDKFPDELSGGQKQRVAIARSMLMKPDIILLDEPTSALDKEVKESVLNLIAELIEENMTLIIVSHEEDFVRKVSDRVIELKNNKLKEVIK